MKSFHIKGLLYLLLTVALLQACGSDDPATPSVQEMLTAGTWTVESVTADNVDKTDAYPNMTITFANETFSAVNGGLIWPSSDTWKLDDTGKKITRGDNVVANIDQISESALVLSLNWDETTLGSGRSRSIEGEYKFTFKR